MAGKGTVHREESGLSSSDFEAPDAVLVNRRWVKASVVDWVRRADAIMVEHGAVNGSRAYARRHQARWRAQRLIGLMIDLGLHERWELAEHTSQHSGGWMWTVEYMGRGGQNG